MPPWFSYAFVGALVLGPTIFKNALYLSALKSIIANQRRAHIELKTGSPAHLPGIDMARIEGLTRQLEELGFEPLVEHLSRISYDEPSSPAHASPFVPPPIASPRPDVAAGAARFVPQGYGRVMVNRNERCVAKIIYSVTLDSTGAVAPNGMLSVGFNSFTGAGEDDWSYSTSDTPYDKQGRAIARLWRHPRRLGTWRVGAAPAELFRLHLERREAIARAAGLTWKREWSLADDKAIEERVMRQIRATFAPLTPLKMAFELWRLQRDNSDEWLGELKGRL